jgi:CheY-like chemotaxis protein
MLSLKKKNESSSPIKNRSKNTIMVIDDEPSNLHGVCGLLEEFYHIVPAGGGQEALDILEENSDIKVIVSDQKMPGMSGVELLSRLKTRNHPAIRLILTGFADINSIISGINQAGIFSYLTKPVDALELRGKVDKAIQKYDVTHNNNRLVRAIEQVQKENQKLKSRLANHIGSDEKDKDNPVLGIASDIAILNGDIRNFTKFSLDRSASEVIEVLQKIFQFLHEHIYEHGGIVDKHMGDGIIAVFGLKSDSSIDTALACVQKIVQSYPEFIKTLKLDSKSELKLGLGLAHGDVSVTKLTVDNRDEISYVGKPLFLSASMQELTKLPLKFDDAKELFGYYDHAMAVIPAEPVGRLPDFKLIALEGKSQLRSFSEISSVGILQS